MKARIVEVIPAIGEIYYHHDAQYERLKELERIKPDNPQKYQLGTWKHELIAKAEDAICGNHNYDVNVLNCAVYIMINQVHTGRNLTKDTDILIGLLKKTGVDPYRQMLEEYFVAQKYMVFSKEEFQVCREKIMNIL